MAARRSIHCPLGWASLALLAACGSEETVSAVGVLTAEPRALAFGEVPVLQRRSLAVELGNVGRAPLSVSRVELLGGDGAFHLEAAPDRVEPDGRSRIEVAFAPQRLDTFAATLRLETTDSAEPLIEVPVTGSSSTAARLELNGPFDFGTVCEGAEALRPLALRSTGTAELVVQSIGFSPDTAAAFAFASSTRTPAVVPPGGELTLTVRFAPDFGAPQRAQGSVVLSTTDPGQPQVSVALAGQVNRAPAAAIAELPVLAPGATAVLDGSASSDAEGDLPLAWTWSLRSSPIGSRSRPEPADGPIAHLLLDLPGRFTVQLTVEDAAGCRSLPALREVIAKPAQQLLVELVWDHADADLDLHLVPEGEAFFGPKDCYFAQGHQRPDWGAPGDPADDPVLERDALTGYGPELIGYAAPAAGRYRAGVHYYSDHRSPSPQTVATLRVYHLGVLRAELKRTLPEEGVLWTALEVEWPGGAVQPIDLLE